MSKKDKTPLSEKVEKQHYDWTAQMCLDELVRLQRLHLDKVITRNFFRANSQISDSTWNRHFGTFLEFRRQAGLELSRQQHQLEKHIAKHTSVDHYREFNKIRQDWGDKYVRKNKTRYQTIITCSDLHDKECDPFYLDVLVDTISRVKPDIVCIVGDLFDLPEFGHYKVDPRQWDVVGRIKAAHDILYRIREAAPDSQLTIVEGNHEFRLLRHLADATTAMMTVLSDLHDFTVPKLLGLDEFEVNYIAKADLAAYRQTDVKKEVSKNYAVFFNCFAAHHFPQGKKLHLPGVNGHHHKFWMITHYSEILGSYNWLQMGAGHVRDASYCQGEMWQLGFAINHIDTQEKQVLIEPVLIDDFACVGGKYYYRH